MEWRIGGSVRSRVENGGTVLDGALAMALS